MILPLTDGGEIAYFEDFFQAEIADKLFEVIKKQTPWKQEVSKFGPLPRLTAWYADQGLTYTYTGITHKVLEWTPALLEIRKRIQEASTATFNSLLLNYYRNGKDSVGWHSDSEKGMGTNPVIASVSLGAAREFKIKHKETNEKAKFSLAHGSLMIMGGTMQHHWLHSIPKTEREVGERINLTFRRVA